MASDLFSNFNNSESNAASSSSYFVPAAACLTVPSSSVHNKSGGVRLQQFRPAWAMHALLRFRGISYRTENVSLPISMGLMLPVLVDGNHVASGWSALQYIAEVVDDNEIHGGGNNVLVGFDHDDELTGTTFDSMMASYVDSALVSTLTTLHKATGSEHVELWKCASFPVAFVLCRLNDIENLIVWDKYVIISLY